MRWARTIDEVEQSLEQPKPVTAEQLEAAAKMLVKAGYQIIPNDKIRAFDAFYEIPLIELGALREPEKLMETIKYGMVRDLAEQAVAADAVTTKTEDQFLKRQIGARITVVMP